jgi:hypothetical protein
MLVGGITTANLSTSATEYSGPLSAAANGTEANVRLPMPVAGTVANLQVSLNGTAGNGKSYVFTVMREGVATGITCTVSGNSATTCSDVANTAAFTAGQAISLRSAPASGPTARTLRWSVTLTE